MWKLIQRFIYSKFACLHLFIRNINIVLFGHTI